MSSVSQEPHRDEGESASPWLSPGLVGRDEIVLRTILDPDHIEANGKLAAAAISLSDIRSRGWSVDRKHFTSPWRIRIFHFRWKRRKPAIRKFYVLPISANEIRRLTPGNGPQEFVITDASVFLNPAHAAVLLAGPKTEPEARGYRNSLLRKLPPYVEISEAFGPADRHGYLRGMIRQCIAILTASVRNIFRR